MFYQKNAEGYQQALPGIRMKTLVYGEKTLLTEYHLRQGSVLPVHGHPHEQTGYLVSGRLRLRLGEDQHEAGAGDSWCIPGNVLHGVDTLEDAVVVEVFSPVREEYLPKS